MAFPTSPTTEAANKVRQKTYMINRNPGIFYALKALFLHLAANEGNPDLRLINVDGLVNSQAGGNSNDQVIVDGPCKLYGLYLKKGTGSVATFFKITNHAATGTTDGSQDLGYKITTASEENLFLFPHGHSLSTGLVVSQNTTGTGATIVVATANTCSGFAIVGQA